MASVHESLYFNPMMTNGVVHANVFGIKDWVTPYKISVLALLHEMTASKITLPERRRLNKLILPLQQVGLCTNYTRAGVGIMYRKCPVNCWKMFLFFFIFIISPNITLKSVKNKNP